jgi:hypothetical protein
MFSGAWPILPGAFCSTLARVPPQHFCHECSEDQSLDWPLPYHGRREWPPKGFYSHGELSQMERVADETKGQTAAQAGDEVWDVYKGCLLV